ncbi:hypothetical protein ScPMuIL_009618 [Solemya velum]
MATTKFDDTFESVRKSKSKKRKHKEGNDSIQSDSVFETPGKGIDRSLGPSKKKAKRLELKSSLCLKRQYKMKVIPNLGKRKGKKRRKDLTHNLSVLRTHLKRLKPCFHPDLDLSLQ